MQDATNLANPGPAEPWGWGPTTAGFPANFVPMIGCSGGAPGTIPSADFFNDWLKNLFFLMDRGGVVPAAGSHTNIYDAIQQIAAVQGAAAATAAVGALVDSDTDAVFTDNGDGTVTLVDDDGDSVTTYSQAGVNAAISSAVSAGLASLPTPFTIDAQTDSAGPVDVTWTLAFEDGSDTPFEVSIADFFGSSAVQSLLQTLVNNQSNVTANASTTLTQAASQIVRYNVSGGAITLTLPSAPNNGDEVTFYDDTFTDVGAALANTLTIARAAGTLIEGQDDDGEIDLGHRAFTLRYLAATTEWIVVK